MRGAAEALRSGEPAILLLGGRTLLELGLTLAGKVAAATGARAMAEMSNARLQRGRGPGHRRARAGPGAGGVRRDQASRPRRSEGAGRVLRLPGQTEPPVAGGLRRPHPRHGGRGRGGCARTARRCARRRRCGSRAPGARPPGPAALADPSTSTTCRASLAQCCPRTRWWWTKRSAWAAASSPTPAARRPTTGSRSAAGRSASGIPLATGAAVACPDRKVIGLQADGSAMYTVQGLWTQAREGLDVTTLMFANRAYASLRHELHGVGGAQPRAQGLDMLDLGRPALDWVSIAKGMGVDAARATTADETGARGRRRARHPGSVAGRDRHVVPYPGSLRQNGEDFRQPAFGSGSAGLGMWR